MEGFRLSLEQGEILLDRLLNDGVGIAHDCGGTGACASCLVVVREGVERLNAALAQAVNTPETRDRFIKYGLIIAPSSPQQLAAFQAEELPPEERLDLARRLVESVVAPASLNETISEGIRRIEDLATGRVKGLAEEEYRVALK